LTQLSRSSRLKNIKLRMAAIGLSLACSAALLSAACGTDAVGVDACRDIEQARCEAAGPCGVIEDVAACRRFYRDHCEHGLALENSPGKVTVRACVDAIQAAGSCAKAGTVLADCTTLAGEPLIGSVCEAVTLPEKLSACSFLAPPPPPPPPPPDSGGPVEAGEAGEAGAG
jgi:hypothetical protein